MFRRATAILVCSLVVVLGGCGQSDVERERERLEERIETARQDARDFRRRARALRERVRERIEAVLDELERTVPQAGPGTRPPTAQGRSAPGSIGAYLDEVLASIDRYWTRTLTANGVAEPRVRFLWVEPGDRVRTGCDGVADDRAAFYCPADDTIYVAQVFAARLYRGVERGFPGEAAGYGRAGGDFGVAYVVAHEYAHNLQAELGFFTSRSVAEGTVKPLELQADCLAGTWANSVYREGKLEPDDVQEALDTALAVGDFDYGNAQHHGTPTERRDAFLLGFESGEPSQCSRYVPR